MGGLKILDLSREGQDDQTKIFQSRYTSVGEPGLEAGRVGQPRVSRDHDLWPYHIIASPSSASSSARSRSLAVRPGKYVDVFEIRPGRLNEFRCA